MSGAIHVAVIRKMKRQLAELINQLNETPPSGISSTTRAKIFRDMLAQREALDEADMALTSIYGEPPATVIEGRAND